MSDSPNTLNNSNTPPEPEDDDLGTFKQPAQDSPGDERSEAKASSEKTPLSSFWDEDDKIPTPPTRSISSAGSNQAIDNSETDPAPEIASSKHIYKISPAEPDWLTYTLTPLDDPPLEEEEVSSWKTAWAVVREVGETIILTLIIFFLIQIVVRNFRVVGTSMLGNLHDGQYLIIDKVSYNGFLMNILGTGGPQRGDVIVFEPPNRPDDDYVKRIVGLPGETVEIINGQVLINGNLLDEPFLPLAGSYTIPPRVVPEGQVFVLGDNRNNSNDSHTWGALPIENIVGRAWLSYWPPDQWGVIPRDGPTKEATLKHFLNELIPSANAESE